MQQVRRCTLRSDPHLAFFQPASEDDSVDLAERPEIIINGAEFQAQRGYMKSVRDYSFGDRKTIACPYDYYKAMRSEDPVHFDEKAGTYIVSRYEDIKQALAQPLVFSSGLGFKNQKRQ